MSCTISTYDVSPSLSFNQVIFDNAPNRAIKFYRDKIDYPLSLLNYT
ncbi:MAG: hypothetical protein IPN29_15265 [Saprospiraceae bacterium]|nr:hypothetical protein [Saprospiraceae bacterium]